jgi:NADPH-dependent stearoyl-CoA 9-desaturase
MKRQLKGIWRKVRKQVGKDYLIFPALAGPSWATTLSANFTANIIRNLWTYTIIFCGHFPDGALHFDESELDDETKAEWYLRQLLGSANLEGNRFFQVMAGSLGYQIEHHLFPDLPCNRYPEMAVRVKDLCEKYHLPYTTGPLRKQYGQVIRTVFKLSLPGKSRTPQPQPPTATSRPASRKRPTREELQEHRGPIPPQAAVA